MKKIIWIVIVGFMLAGGALKGFAQEGERLTHEEFAVELVKLMKINDLLPIAALPKDSIYLLERLGITPLKGWGDPKAPLAQEDYLVLIGKAQGKEGLVHKRAVAVEEKNREIINRKWEQAYKDMGRWLSLSELFNNPAYFPNGAPQSPYGARYKDSNNDHKVDPIYLPASGLVELRKFLATE